jgi:hypothetical protein
MNLILMAVLYGLILFFSIGSMFLAYEKWKKRVAVPQLREKLERERKERERLKAIGKYEKWKKRVAVRQLREKLKRERKERERLKAIEKFTPTLKSRFSKEQKTSGAFGQPRWMRGEEK